MLVKKHSYGTADYRKVTVTYDTVITSYSYSGVLYRKKLLVVEKLQFNWLLKSYSLSGC